MSDVQQATVSQASPLQVRVDGSSAEVNGVSLNSASFSVGARVAVVPLGRRLLVLGTVA